MSTWPVNTNVFSDSERDKAWDMAASFGNAEALARTIPEGHFSDCDGRWPCSCISRIRAACPPPESSRSNG